MIRGVVSLFAALWLCGCASTAPTSPTSPRLQPQLGPAKTVHAAFPAAFTLEARMSVKREDRLDSLRLTWIRSRQSGDSQDTVRVFTPLGSQVAELRVDRHEAVLIRGADRVTAERMTTLTENLIGVPFDFSYLERWLLPSDGSVPQSAASGTWQVIQEKFATFGGHLLASRVRAEQRGAGESAEVRVVVDDFVPQ